MKNTIMNNIKSNARRASLCFMVLAAFGINSVYAQENTSSGAESRAKKNVSKYETKVVLNLAVNYGGRHEITQGVQAIAQKVANGELSPEDITEEMISQSLYTKNLPDPDLIIRPSGEYRLSNFLTWQSAYSEFWFSNVLWPDFTEEHLCEALREFEKRNRRFGGV